MSLKNEEAKSTAVPFKIQGMKCNLLVKKRPNHIVITSFSFLVLEVYTIKSVARNLYIL